MFERRSSSRIAGLAAVVVMLIPFRAFASCPNGQECGVLQFSDGLTLNQPSWTIIELDYHDNRAVPMATGDGGWLFWDGCIAGGAVFRIPEGGRWKHNPGTLCGALDYSAIQFPSSVPSSGDDLGGATQLLAMVDVMNSGGSAEVLETFFGFGTLVEVFSIWNGLPFGLSNYHGMIKQGTTIKTIVGKGQPSKGWSNATYSQMVGTSSGQQSYGFAVLVDLVAQTTKYYLDGVLVDTTSGSSLWPSLSSRRLVLACGNPVPTSDGSCRVKKFTIAYKK